MRRTQSVSDELNSVSKACRILADPTRLAILDLLTQGVQCNCVFGDRLGLRMNLISHHLKVLRGAGLVSISRDSEDARWIYYSLNAKKLAEMSKLIGSFLGKEISTSGPVCAPTKVRGKRALLPAG
jgi:ArsR family transcriptional regulator